MCPRVSPHLRYSLQGAFGEIFLCYHKTTGAKRAVKLLEKSKYRQEINDEVLNEFKILKSLDHPNLVKVYEMVEEDERYQIVTDLYDGGDLLDKIEELGKFEEEQ